MLSPLQQLTWQGIVRLHNLVNGLEALMPSKSKAQQRLMQAAAHNPAIAKSTGVPQSVAKEYAAADKARGSKKLPERKK